MTRRFYENAHFPDFTERLNDTAKNLAIQNNFNEESCGVTVVAEKSPNTTFIGTNPIIQIESEHVTLETQVTSRVVLFIPGFHIDDHITIVLNGNEEDIEKIMVYALLEDPSGENFLSTEIISEKES